MNIFPTQNYVGVPFPTIRVAHTRGWSCYIVESNTVVIALRNVGKRHAISGALVTVKHLLLHELGHWLCGNSEEYAEQCVEEWWDNVSEDDIVSLIPPAEDFAVIYENEQWRIG